MASQVISSTPKGVKLALLGLSATVVFLMGLLIGPMISPKINAVADNPKHSEDQGPEMSLSIGGVGVKMKARELGKTLDNATRYIGSKEMKQAMLQDPNSPLVKLSKAHFPKKMWGAAAATVEAAERAGRGDDPKFDLLREYLKFYDILNNGKKTIIVKGKKLPFLKKHRLHELELWGARVNSELKVLANSGETIGHLRHYRKPDDPYSGYHLGSPEREKHLKRVIEFNRDNRG